jgi:hypothetical protein
VEKLLLGGKRKAKDDQSTCRAENSTPKASKYNRDLYFGFRDVLIPDKKGLNVTLIRKKKSSEYEAQRTKTISGNEVMQTSLTNLDTLYPKKR